MGFNSSSGEEFWQLIGTQSKYLWFIWKWIIYDLYLGWKDSCLKKYFQNMCISTLLENTPSKFGQIIWAYLDHWVYWNNKSLASIIDHNFETMFHLLHGCLVSIHISMSLCLQFSCSLQGDLFLKPFLSSMDLVYSMFNQVMFHIGVIFVQF